MRSLKGTIAPTYAYARPEGQHIMFMWLTLSYFLLFLNCSTRAQVERNNRQTYACSKYPDWRNGVSSDWHQNNMNNMLDSSPFSPNPQYSCFCHVKLLSSKKGTNTHFSGSKKTVLDRLKGMMGNKYKTTIALLESVVTRDPWCPQRRHFWDHVTWWKLENLK